MRPKKLGDDQVAEMLSTLDGWKLIDGAIQREYVFSDFLQSIAFVNSMAQSAEEMQHHPDLDIRYNKVKTMLSTHDVGGLTELDFQLAAIADTVAQVQTKS